MDYAIIEINNHQILVKPGSKFSVLGELGQVGDTIKNAKVLLYKDGQAEIGTPYVNKTIDLKIVSVEKTDKIDVFKYKAKSRYRRRNGHRQMCTILEWAEPTVSKVASKKTAAKPKTAKEK